MEFYFCYLGDCLISDDGCELASIKIYRVPLGAMSMTPCPSSPTANFPSPPKAVFIILGSGPPCARKWKLCPQIIWSASPTTQCKKLIVLQVYDSKITYHKDRSPSALPLGTTRITSDQVFRGQLPSQPPPGLSSRIFVSQHEQIIWLFRCRLSFSDRIYASTTGNAASKLSHLWCDHTSTGPLSSHHHHHHHHHHPNLVYSELN